MNRNHWMALAAVIGVLLCGVSEAAPTQPDFAADMVMTSPEGRMQAKIFTSNKKFRMEMAGSVVITRMDLNLSWVIMEAERMYMEQRVDPGMVAKTAGDPSAEIERTPLGPDPVDGKPAEKFKVTYAVNGARESVYQWNSPATPVPVKMAALDGSWSVTYQNIRTGAQDPKLFEVPAGYQKFAMPDMGQLGQMAGAYGGQ